MKICWSPLEGQILVGLIIEFISKIKDDFTEMYLGNVDCLIASLPGSDAGTRFFNV